MKLSHLFKQRRKIFLCLALTMLSAGLSAQDPNNWCGTMPTPPSWKDCNKHLLPKYTPICPGSHCDQFQSTGVFHDYCAARSIYDPVPTTECCNPSTKQWIEDLVGHPVPINQMFKECAKAAATDPNWGQGPCYCCCSCFADKTRIATPEGEEAIKNIKVGSEVLTAKFSIDEGTVSLSWQPSRVQASVGAEGNSPAMVYIEYGDQQELIVSPDQVLLSSTGHLIQAIDLIPGFGSKDDLYLTDKEGNSVQIHTVSVGSYKGGIHHIETNAGSTGIDDHLILSEGVVSGDFYLQKHFPNLSTQYKTSSERKLVSVGSEEYIAKTKLLGLYKKQWIYSNKENVEFPPTFVPFDQPETNIPYGASSYFTQAQALDILMNGSQRPIYDKTNYSLVTQYIFPLIRGFYPDVILYVDWVRGEPNVYAFEEYDKKIIVISGGLIRMDGLFEEGLTMILAHAISEFYADKPESENYACVCNADYDAFANVSRRLWNSGSTWYGEVSNGLRQIQKLFGFISKKNAQGNPLDVCHNPAIDCRVETIQDAIPGADLPECAGGAAPVPLQLEKASGNINTIDLIFNEGLDPVSALSIENYSISSSGTITKVTIDSSKNFIVHLEVSGLEVGKTYEINVSNLSSIFGSNLDPQYSSVKFTPSVTKTSKSYKDDL